MIVTWFVSVTTFVVAGMWLFSRWIVRALAAPEFFESYKTIGLVSTGVMLYALYLVLVVVLGRTGRTEYNFPATAAGTVTNIGLNLLLLPSMGIVGAGISLVASYAVVLVLMYVFTQRLFPVPYEWLRLAQALGLADPRGRRRAAASDLRSRRSCRAGCGLARVSAAAVGHRLLERGGALRGRQLLDPSAAMARLRACAIRPPEEPPRSPRGRGLPAHPRDARGRAARRGRDPLDGSTAAARSSTSAIRAA